MTEQLPGAGISGAAQVRAFPICLALRPWWNWPGARASRCATWQTAAPPARRSSDRAMHVSTARIAALVRHLESKGLVLPGPGSPRMSARSASP